MPLGGGDQERRGGCVAVSGDVDEELVVGDLERGGDLADQVQVGLPVDLPKASTGQPHSSQNLTITVSATGDLHLNTKPITAATETDELKALNVTAGTLIIINADGRVSHGTVTTVMDNARKAGIERFAIATAS